MLPAPYNYSEGPTYYWTLVSSRRPLWEKSLRPGTQTLHGSRGLKDSRLLSLSRGIYRACRSCCPTMVSDDRRTVFSLSAMLPQSREIQHPGPIRNETSQTTRWRVVKTSHKHENHFGRLERNPIHSPLQIFALPQQAASETFTHSHTQPTSLYRSQQWTQLRWFHLWCAASSNSGIHICGPFFQPLSIKKLAVSLLCDTVYVDIHHRLNQRVALSFLENGNELLRRELSHD